MSKWRHVGLLVAGFLALSASTSFGAEGHSGTLGSAVLINNGLVSGSGVYIGDDRIVTAAHVVAKGHDDADAGDSHKRSSGRRPFGDRVFVTVSRNDAPAESVGAKVIGFDLREDIAMLKLDLTIPDLPAAKLACRAPVVGESIEAVGNPLGQTFIHTWGRVAGVMRADDNWPHMVPIDLSIAPGSSGGPVYDKDGKVLGFAIGLAYGGDSEKVVKPGTVGMMVSTLPLCNHLGLKSDDAAASTEFGGAPSVIAPARKVGIADQTTPAPACDAVAYLLAEVAKENLTVTKFEGDDYLKYATAFGKVTNKQADASGGDAIYVVSELGSNTVLLFQAKNGCLVGYSPIPSEINDKVLDAMKAAG